MKEFTFIYNLLVLCCFAVFPLECFVEIRASRLLTSQNFVGLGTVNAVLTLNFYSSLLTPPYEGDFENHKRLVNQPQTRGSGDS